jgi:hypothetical protein
MDVTIDEEEVAMAVLNGLPPKYDNLIVALDTICDDTKLTLEFTKSRSMQEEQSSDERELSVGNVSDIIALVSLRYDQTTLCQNELLGSELDQIRSSRRRRRRRRRR